MMRLSVVLVALLSFAAGQGGYSYATDTYSWDALEPFKALELAGEELTILGPLTGPDAAILDSVLEYFRSATGVSVVYEGSDAFEQQIVSAVQGGSPPDIAVFPQPGLAADLAAQGYLTPLEKADADWLRETYAAGESWLELSSFNDENGDVQLFALPYKVDLKSLVWYSPQAFDEAGYRVPRSFEGLLELSEQIAADGAAPWCIGLGAGEATGWPATDWVEDILLRSAGADIYDAWVAHDVPFDNAAVVEAIEIFGQFAKNEDWLNVAPEQLADVDYRDAATGLFSNPPQCYLHHQASFIPSFFPANTELGEDADFFYFPEFAAETDTPVLGAGTLWAMTEESEAARALFDFLKTPLAHELWMAQGGFLTPHTGVNTNLYLNDTLRGQGDILLNATTFRFDASDLMPGAIGAGAFWQTMIDYVSTDMDAAEAAAQIEAVWEGLE